MEENSLIKRSRPALIGLTCALFAAAMLSGCGRVRTGVNGSSAESETQEAQSETARTVRVVIEEESESETEPETQKLITSVEYTSKDGTVKITLPDNTWKVTQDADEMRAFSSGNDAMINVVHASTEAAMKTLSMHQTKEDLEAALLQQYNDPNAFSVESYEKSTIGNVNVYRYVVKYNAAARMWAYAVTYGIQAPDQAYMITGTVTDDNLTLLKAVEESVDSFSVIKDETLKTVTDNRTGETEVRTTPQTTAQTTAAVPASDELSTLTAYQQGSTMYSSDVVNVRSAPGTDSGVIQTVDIGGKVTVTGETSGWYQVSVNGVTGYIRKDLLSATQTTTPSSSTTSETSEPETTAAGGSAEAAEIATATNYSNASTLYATDGVYIRSNPGTDSGVVGSLGTGNAVTVVGETDNWYIVDTGAGRGYVSKAYLSSTAPAAAPSDQTGNGTASGGTSGTGGTQDPDAGGQTASGGDAQNSAGGGTDSQNTDTQTSGTATISGTVTNASASTVTVAGDDGNTYTIYTGDADITSADGLHSGVRISASVDNSQTAADGTKYATSVTGE